MKIIYLFFIFQIVKLKKLKNYDVGTLFYKYLKLSKLINETEYPLFEYCLSKNTNTTDNIIEILYYSGKNLGDLGKSRSCEKLNFTYFLYYFKFNPLSFNSTDNGQIKTFLDQKDYFVGFCLPTFCIKCFNILIYRKQGIFKEISHEFLEHSIMIKRNILDKNKDFKNDFFIDKSIKIKYEKGFKFFSYIIIIYLFFFFICTFIKIFFFFSISLNQEENKRNYDELEDEEEEEEVEEEEDESNILFNSIASDKKLKKNENIIFKRQIPFLLDENSPLIKIEKFISFFDIFNNLKLFMSFSNHYYNNTSIEIIGFIRIIIMFGIIFGKTFIVQFTTFPQIDIFNYNFYNDTYFIFIKLTFYANIAWIILDGTIFGFKLMSYLKKIIKNNKYFSFNIYIKFYKYLLPKIICFFFIYFFFDIMISNFTNNNLLLDYYIKIKINRLECYNSPFKIFNPLYFYINQNNTFSTENTLNNYEKCYEYTNIFINEFYAIIILSFILYLSLIIQSKIFDLIITFLILVNLFTISFFYNRGFDNYDKYYINIFLGQKFTEHYFHLFISIFFLGFLIGLIFFHYHDSVSNDNFGKEYYDFIPFSYTKYIMNKLNDIQSLYKKFLLIILIILIFILALPVYIYNNKFGLKIEKEDKKIIKTLKYIDIYEKSIFAIIFSILLILLKLITENSYFLNFELIGTFERIKLSFYCTIELFINFSHTLLRMNHLFTYLNIFYLSVGLFILSYIFNIIFTILFILPFEKLIKRKIKIEKKPNEIYLLNSIVKNQ